MPQDSGERHELAGVSPALPATAVSRRSSADNSSYAAFTPASTFLLSSTLSSTLRIYNIHTSKVLKTLRAPTLFVSEKFPCPALLYPAIVVEDGMDIDTSSAGDQKTKKKGEAWVVSGSENGKVVIWELSTRRVAQVLDDGGHTTPVVAVAVSLRQSSVIVVPQHPGTALTRR